MLQLPSSGLKQDQHTLVFLTHAQTRIHSLILHLHIFTIFQHIHNHHPSLSFLKPDAKNSQCFKTIVKISCFTGSEKCCKTECVQCSCLSLFLWNRTQAKLNMFSAPVLLYSCEAWQRQSWVCSVQLFFYFLVKHDNTKLSVVFSKQTLSKCLTGLFQNFRLIST